MDSARQVIRWSMPGWVFLFWLGGFQIIQNVWVFGSIGAAMERSLLSQLSTGAAAIVIGSGVPLGFLIYQLYYHAYDHWMPFSFAPQDRGGDIISELGVEVKKRLHGCEPELVAKGGDDWETLDRSRLRFIFRPIFGPDLRRLKKRPWWGSDPKDRYRKNRQFNFELLRFYLTAISAELESESFRQEYTNLSDIYNAIGASRMALICSFLSYAGYNLLLSPAHLGALFEHRMIPLALNGLIFIMALRVVQSRRTRTGVACQAILSHTINWYVLEKKKDSAPSILQA